MCTYIFIIFVLLRVIKIGESKTTLDKNRPALGSSCPIL